MEGLIAVVHSSIQMEKGMKENLHWVKETDLAPIYNDGAKYSGDFKDVLFHGEGTYIWPDGQKTTGRWENGEYIGI
jgi:hypothetical protein